MNEEFRFHCQKHVYTRHMPSHCSQGHLYWSTSHVNTATRTGTPEEDSYFDCFFFAVELAISRMVCPTEPR